KARWRRRCTNDPRLQSEQRDAQLPPRRRVHPRRWRERTWLRGRGRQRRGARALASWLALKRHLDRTAGWERSELSTKTETCRARDAGSAKNERLHGSDRIVFPRPSCPSPDLIRRWSRPSTSLLWLSSLNEDRDDKPAATAAAGLPRFLSPGACRLSSGFQPRSRGSRHSRRDPSSPERSGARR